ncbi:MAG: ParA family protein [Magnetococcales bacterium]|nr:ParA family protein [Magnetococcales bacterium]
MSNNLEAWADALAMVMTSDYFTRMFNERNSGVVRLFANRLWFMSGKGGVGKSLIVSVVAKIFADTGYHVLVIDTSSLGGAQAIFERADEPFKFYNLDMLRRSAVYKDLVKGNIGLVKCSVYEYMIHDSFHNDINRHFDFVLIDTDAGFPITAESSIMWGDIILITTQDPGSIVGTSAVIEAILSKPELKHTSVGMIINFAKLASKKVIYEALASLTDRNVYDVIDFHGLVLTSNR